MVSGLTSDKIRRPKYYWTTINERFQEHLFLHHSDHFVPFHFVLDTPQSQYGHESVTWNFGFDNLPVQIRDSLQRVVRLDKRYLYEMGWLVGNTDPSAVFIYGWNEPCEGSLLLPTQKWSDTKAKLAQHFIEKLSAPHTPALPRTLLIVDDLSRDYTGVADDWHIQVQRSLLHYQMRRFAPQSDVCMSHVVTEELLASYDLIIDLSTFKSAEFEELLLFRPGATFSSSIRLRPFEIRRWQHTSVRIDRRAL